MFVDRQAELAFLNGVLERQRPSAAQLILLYGRRRVGKTVLLRHWAEASSLSHIYWAADVTAGKSHQAAAGSSTRFLIAQETGNTKLVTLRQG